MFDPSDTISAPMTVHRARKKGVWGDEDAEMQRALRAMRGTWGAFSGDVDRALEALRRPALDAIAIATSATPPQGNVVAVCVLMRSGAVGGDREATFTCVVRDLRARGIDVYRVGAGISPSMSVLREELSGRSENGRVVLALDDADAMAIDTLRDICYVCAKLGNNLALVAGCAASAEPVHTALGAHEAASVATVVVEMPRAREVLSCIVERVLCQQTRGIQLCREVYEVVEREFFERDCTLNFVMRVLRHAHTLHFMSNPIASIMAPPVGDSLIVDDEEECAVEVADELCETLRTKVMSVQEIGEAELGDEEMRRRAATWIKDIAAVRRRRRTVEWLVWELLQRSHTLETGVESRLGRERDVLRATVFKAFLPGAVSIHKQMVVRVVREEMAQAQRHQLLRYIELMVSNLPANGDPVLEKAADELKRSATELRDTATGATPSAQPKRNSLRAKGGAAALGCRRAALLGEAKQANAGKGKYAGIRKKVLDVFDKLLDDATCIARLPMREGVCFDRLADMAKTSGGIGGGGGAEPRNTVVRSMREPEKYVGSLERRQVPDIAIAYQVLSEGSRLVNLYDWYNTFSALRSGDESGDEGGAAAEVRMQARFARAVSELEFLGLIKHTKRKTDHVQRLVFE